MAIRNDAYVALAMFKAYKKMLPLADKNERLYRLETEYEEIRKIEDRLAVLRDKLSLLKGP